MARLYFLPLAEREYEKAYAWYFQRSPRTAAGFQEIVIRARDAIAANPTRWPIYSGNYRYYYLRPYSYILVYRMKGEDVEVVAIAHAKRRPGYWKRRR